MKILKYVPPPPLSDFVTCLWHYDRLSCQHTSDRRLPVAGSSENPAKERVLPTNEVRLCIRLHDDVFRFDDPRDAERTESLRGPIVWGPHSEHAVIGSATVGVCMGVKFKSGGAFPFLGAPAGEFYGKRIPLSDLWGNAAVELRDQLLEARTPNARFRILERYLFSQVHVPLERHPAVTSALKEFQAIPHDQKIADLSKRTGLSSKWFIELFRAQVGLTPKLYCRLRRFRTALTLIGRQQRVDWAGLAQTCGYFDQAHFIRDFHAFSGLSPTSYLANRTEPPCHVRCDSQRPRILVRWTEFNLSQDETCSFR